MRGYFVWQLFPLNRQETECQQWTESQPDEDSDTEEILCGIHVSITFIMFLWHTYLSKTTTEVFLQMWNSTKQPHFLWNFCRNLWEVLILQPPVALSCLDKVIVLMFVSAGELCHWPLPPPPAGHRHWVSQDAVFRLCSLCQVSVWIS